MGYVDNNLMPGEEVKFRTRLNIKLFVFPCLIVIALIGAGVWLLMHATPYTIWAGVFFLVAFLFLLHSYIVYMSSEFAVTNKRVIIKVGFISRKTSEMLLEKITTIEVDQSVFGRMFNWGTVTIIGTGGTKDSFQNISDPIAFRLAVYEQTDARTLSR